MERFKIDVTLSGLSDIMFDKFIDHSKEKRPPSQKFYLHKDNQVILPAANIDSFLFGNDPKGCAKKFESKKSQDYISYGLSHIFIDPLIIPFKNDNNEAITFNDFENGPFRVFEMAGRVGSGSKRGKAEIEPRPVLSLPWNLSFQITLLNNELIPEGNISITKLYNWFTKGGFVIGLGTYRPRYGRFEVTMWEEKEGK